ncbi:MAG: helix-turn-helix domain-containing protein [Hahellaceae bacterium]|nr:helix-turn-helix domain-containing protein [Hahellaceae bacterium]MCP5169975.1 helix-turn-helix domain-containing protein [Hahellaceae bacterium]
MSDKLLTLAEVSKLLDKPEVTVKRYAKESLLPSVKQGADLMFPEAAVLKYIEISKKLK